MTMAMEPTDLQGAITAAVIVRDGQVLLIRRRQKEGTLLWALPSGEIESGESPELAAQRETLEEVGYLIDPKAVLGERIHPNTGRKMIYVACTPGDGEPEVLDHDEIAELAWVSKDRLPELVPYGFYDKVQDYLDTLM
jgi:8-oxo-dGTP diphosphatase